MTRDVRSIHLTIKKKTVKCVVPPPRPLYLIAPVKKQNFDVLFQDIDRLVEELKSLSTWKFFDFEVFLLKKKIKFRKKEKRKMLFGEEAYYVESSNRYGV